ncbi:Protein FRA10AC1 [Strongyloides ratti]|uniref:Protein FRA10AC1 n=1 Tax=Strongyloides ratti TaxID=34506 RepID=A0A090LES4_STRRB|nr:Protein FRA10AC1 [Strongyloides ratti]CEF68266.1 Protein FRA10AC1 [Strongyloides ratti]
MGKHKEKKEKHKIEKTLKNMDIFKRHQKLISTFVEMKQKEEVDLAGVSKDNASNIVKCHMKFIYDKNIDENKMTWEEKLAKRYYDRIYKEYCIADLSKYKENKIALRWRLEAEVKKGKGQFICGGKDCESKESLSTWEVNFKYKEKDEIKNALVKVCLCEECSKKLNFHSAKKKINKIYKEIKKKIKKKISEDVDDKKISNDEDYNEYKNTNKYTSTTSQETLTGSECVNKNDNSQFSTKNTNYLVEELDTFLDNYLLR